MKVYRVWVFGVECIVCYWNVGGNIIEKGLIVDMNDYSSYIKYGRMCFDIRSLVDDEFMYFMRFDCYFWLVGVFFYKCVIVVFFSKYFFRSIYLVYFCEGKGLREWF